MGAGHPGYCYLREGTEREGACSRNKTEAEEGTVRKDRGGAVSWGDHPKKKWGDGSFMSESKTNRLSLCKKKEGETKKEKKFVLADPKPGSREIITLQRNTRKKKNPKKTNRNRESTKQEHKKRNEPKWGLDEGL